MKETLAFLDGLALHNDRLWFNAHKAEYQAAAARFSALVEELIEGIRAFDDTIGPLQPKDCIYRIYRDIRFSKDKSPYKTHMGAYINRGGKKSGYSGYYFHVGAKGTGNMVAAGDIMCPPDVLKIIREDIQMGDGDFRRIISQAGPRLVLDESQALKRVPPPFPADSPDAPLFKLKYYCLFYEPDNRFMTARNLKEKLLDLFHDAKPFLDYINRAVEYAQEEKRAGWRD
ncbi:MAG: DUF2461 domain-containing protein [Bacteroidales bacterium]|nr:DUF2461 domain-containing protein [Bacteroidales bacterium]